MIVTVFKDHASQLLDLYWKSLARFDAVTLKQGLVNMKRLSLFIEVPLDSESRRARHPKRKEIDRQWKWQPTHILPTLLHLPLCWFDQTIPQLAV